jgi:hypothetical protein
MGTLGRRKQKKTRATPPSAGALHAFRLAQARVLLELNGLDGALVDAGAAIDALVFVDLGLAINHGDGFDGAGANAALATRALLDINFRSHFDSPYSLVGLP